MEKNRQEYNYYLLINYNIVFYENWFHRCLPPFTVIFVREIIIIIHNIRYQKTDYRKRYIIKKKLPLVQQSVRNFPLLYT